MFRVLTLLMVACLAAAPGRQNIIPDALACATCSIEVTSRVVIPDSVGSTLLFGTLSAITVDASGKYWVAAQDEPLLVFDAEGQFIRTVGRQGDGPGEFRLPVTMAIGDESVALLDGQQRVTEFDLEYEPRRTKRLPLRRIWEATFFGGPDRLLVAGLGEPTTVGRRPFSIVDLSADPPEVVRRFGPLLEDPNSRTGYYRLRHVLDAPRDDSIWVAERLRYQVSRWNTQGELQARLVRQPEWFAGFSRGLLGGVEKPAEPSIMGISSDASGRLWVFITVSRPGWREAWAEWAAGNGIPPNGDYGGELPPTGDLVATMVEVLDVDRRRVIHRETLDSFAIGVLPGARVVTNREGPDYEPIVEVLELSLRGQ